MANKINEVEIISFSSWPSGMIRDKQMKRPKKNELIGAFQAY